jgi:peroxisomal 3,2-trans-enoyl-CoA isomerase
VRIAKDRMTAIVDSTVSVEYRGRVAIITLNNPKKLNALGAEGYYTLAHYMRDVATHDEVVITVLTAKGSFFSA